MTDLERKRARLRQWLAWQRYIRRDFAAALDEAPADGSSRRRRDLDAALPREPGRDEE